MASKAVLSRARLAAATFAVAVALTGCGSPEGASGPIEENTVIIDYPFYDSVQELSKESD